MNMTEARSTLKNLRDQYESYVTKASLLSTLYNSELSAIRFEVISLFKGNFSFALQLGFAAHLEHHTKEYIQHVCEYYIKLKIETYTKIEAHLLQFPELKN